MSKHHDLCRIWAEAGLGDAKKYKAYRDAFTPKDVYPNKNHADYEPLLTELKSKFDVCSKLIHGSVFGMAGHFATVPKNEITTGIVNLFDMPQDSLVSSFFFILATHSLILQLFGRVFEPYTTDFDVWKTEYVNVGERLQRHLQKWGNISAQYAARNEGRKVSPSEPRRNRPTSS